MNLSLKTALLAACVAVGLTACGTSHLKKTGESHHAAGGMAEPSADCKAETTAPALRCAKSPTATFAPNGVLWVVWQQHDRLYVSHSDNLGGRFSTPVAVNAVPEPIEDTGEARPKIVAGKSGAVYVAWTKRLSKPHTGQIRFSRSLDSGRTFTTPIQINSDAGEIGHRFETLAVNDRDYVYLAWIDKRDKTDIEQAGGQYPGAALYYALSTDGGRSFRPNQKIVDHVCECCRLGMKIDHGKFPTIMWRQVFDGQIRDPALTHFSAKDKPGPIQRISDDHWHIEGCPHHGPALSITPQGDYAVAWFTNGDHRKGLFFSGSRDQGKTFSPPLGFGQGAQAGHADVLADGRTIHLVWTEFDGKATQLREQHSADDGLSWSAPKTLADSQSGADHPFLLSRLGQPYVAWNSQDHGFRLIAVTD